MSNKTCARVKDFEERPVYYPAKRPGYTAWVSLFQFGNGDLGLAFSEIRRGNNPDFKAPTIEFVEAMGIPYRMTPDVLPASNRDLISEHVSLKSSDGGRTWQETGRSAMTTRQCWYTGLPDGRLARAISTQHYRYEVGEDRHYNVIEESRDGGSTWTEIARIMEGKFFYIHKFKRLWNGSIVAAGPVLPSFGPGGDRPQRHTTMPGHIRPDQSAFLLSEDGGHTWDGPHYILAGVEAWEPDFVELADGSLLLINSTVQAGRAVRQIVRKTRTGWVNEPLMEIHRGRPIDDNIQGGFTPETVVMRPDGLIVGARRGSVYSCSRDLGENWYEIEGAPVCNYQPIIECLPDGRLLAAWHFGADSRFGEYDMHIGVHEFRVEAALPAPTKLTLERQLSQDGGRHINAFSATLTADDKPVPGREIELRIKKTWLDQPDGRVNPTGVWESLEVRKATTDEQGVARFALADKDLIPDIHHYYMVAVSFTPKERDEVVACKGPTRGAYTMTAARNDPAPYPIYLNHGLVMITPETAERFPDLADLVKAFNVPNPDARIDRWIEAASGEKRAKEILGFLMENHVVSLDSKGVYHWYRSVHSGREGEPWIHEVRLCDLEEHCV